VGVSLWEEDFSYVLVFFDQMRAKGVDNLARLLEGHPELVEQAVSLVRVLDVNQESIRLFEASSKKELTASLHNVFTPETLSVFRRQLVSLAAGEDFFSAEVRVQTLRGREIEVAHTVRVLSRAAGLALVSVMDISPLKRAQDRLVEAARRKDLFIATLSHELRNPLSAIRNTLDFPDLHKEENQRLAHDLVERQTKRMGRLIDGLLDTSRIEHGKFQLFREPTDWNQVVRDCLRDCRTEIQASGLDLVVDLPASAIVVNADGVRLAQVVENLLTNALKYTRAPGTVTVTIREEGEQALLIVTDTGMGILPGYLPRIFEAFSQSVEHAEHARGGLGIGLSLVKAIVELHGGTVAVESAGPGRGSRFEVSLPRVRQ
jgi:signal transduction histidine kinase